MKRLSSSAIPAEDIAGLAKPVSRLVMGAGSFAKGDPAAAYDTFFEAGGTCFDTAHVYGGGADERALGAWIAQRGVREQVVILAKGAHPPHCAPEHIAPQLDESLDRLGVDHVDVYMLHRDDRDVPVAEFLSALAELQDAGRVGVVGASNWEVDRLAEAHAYAQTHGIDGFAAVSNQLSLVQMVAPPWPGSVSARDSASRAWLAETGTPLVCWASMGGGFLAPGAERSTDPELARCWASSGNEERRRRADRLAAAHGTSRIAIALRWVLDQPFPTFPIVGVKSPERVHEALASLSVSLSATEHAWLDLRDEDAPTSA